MRGQSLLIFHSLCLPGTKVQSKHKHLTTMRRFSFLFLLCLVVLLLPLAAHGDLRNVVCLGHGNRTEIDSEYEANIGRLAAMLPSKTSSSSDLSTGHEVGEFPDRLYAVSRCRNSTDSLSCRACITLALKEAQRACPDHREFVFSNGNCSLQLYDVQFDDLNIMESGIVVMALEKGNVMMRYLSLAVVFQAIGLAWLCFLLLQDWHEKKRGSQMRSSSLPSGDK